MTTSKNAKQNNVKQFPVKFHNRMTVEQVKGAIDPEEHDDVIVIGIRDDDTMTYLTSGMTVPEVNYFLDRAKDFFLHPEDYMEVD